MTTFARRRLTMLGVVLLALTGVSAPVTAGAAWEETDVPAFSADLERVREVLGIPGMSAAVIADGEVVWEGGLGLADLDRGIPATPHTPYGLASVTKPVAAVLVMQLVSEGLIDLDAPIREYGVHIDEAPDVTSRHLLTHTSDGVPGTVHRYDGSRYALLGGVIDGATGQSFSELLGERVLVPLGMDDTAVNPIEHWGGSELEGLDDFRRALGLGSVFDRYPDVYERLSRPYQLDVHGEAVPGMYHLSHSPAAGLLSSVHDLAVFDIALDGGRLLDDAAMQEMWTQAYPTTPGRDDLGYGLGWYVQDFDGTRLLWHAGRWPPSTSALYLKVPSERLTFIVAANTDNLTVPFPGIGGGDISQSTPARTFFRHFLFPRTHGEVPPAVDWTSELAAAASLVASVEDDAVRTLLERELWSYRQAYASTGGLDRAEALRAAAVEWFPDSALGRDPAITLLSSPTPPIEPLASAATMTRVARAGLVWFGLVFVSLGWMAWVLVGSATPTWSRVLWLAACLVLGPVAVAAKRWGGALARSVLTILGFSIGWTVGIWLLIGYGEDAGPGLVLAAIYVAPLLTGLTLVRAPLLRSRGMRYPTAVRRGFVSELSALDLSAAVFFPMTMAADERLLSTIPPPSSPFFWILLSTVGMAALVVLVPFHAWLARRGFDVWPVEPAATAVVLRLPSIADAWWVLLGTFLLFVGSLVATVSLFG